MPLLSIALTKGKNVLENLTDDSTLPHSQRLFPLITNILHRNSIALNQLEAIAVNTGPGSFTGVRVGLAAAKGLAKVLGKPLYGVNSFDAIALALGIKSSPIIILLNAARGEIFLGMRELDEFGNIQRSAADRVGKLEDFVSDLSSLIGTRRAIFTGSAVTPNWEYLSLFSPSWEKHNITTSYTHSLAQSASAQLRAGAMPINRAYYIRLADAELKFAK